MIFIDEKKQDMRYIVKVYSMAEI